MVGQQQIKAIRIDEFDGHLIPDASDLAVFRFKQGGQVIDLAMAAPVIASILKSCARSLAELTPRGKMQSGYRQATKSDWYEVGKTEGGLIAVSFRLEGSPGFLDFVIDPVMAGRLGEALQAATQASSSQSGLPPGTTLS